MGKWGFNDERKPTSPYDSVEVCGVRLSSRWRKADELDLMARVVRELGPELLSCVAEIWCDSNACSCYSVTLRPERSGLVWQRALARVLDGLFLQHAGGHNGIFLPDLVSDPWWAGDDEGMYAAEGGGDAGEQYDD